MTVRRLLCVVAVAASVAGACSSSAATVTGTTAAPTTTSSTSTTPESATPTTTEPDADPWVDVVPGVTFDGVLLGVSTGLSRAERIPRFDDLESVAGRSFDIGHVFHSWETAIPTEDDLYHLDAGRLLLISWNGTDTLEIVAGEHDEWIRRQAQAVRELDRRVLLRWFWEMDGRRRLPLVHSGPDYVAAWDHLRAIFAAEGATNAEWVWCPNDFLFRDGDPDEWYPGDDAVDWLCADGYNWGTSTGADDWDAIDEIFAAFHDWAAPRGKPIVIAETGSGEAEPGAKATWIASIPGLLREQLPEIDAVVWFDKDFSDRGHRDWRVDTSADAYAAWVAIANDEWLNPLDR